MRDVPIFRGLWKILSEIDMLGKYSIAYPLVQMPIGVGYSGAKLPGFDLHNTAPKDGLLDFFSGSRSPPSSPLGSA
jgi:hypothetical protein